MPALRSARIVGLHRHPKSEACWPGDSSEILRRVSIRRACWMTLLRDSGRDGKGVRLCDRSRGSGRELPGVERIYCWSLAAACRRRTDTPTLVRTTRTLLTWACGPSKATQRASFSKKVRLTSTDLPELTPSSSRASIFSIVFRFRSSRIAYFADATAPCNWRA